MRARSAVTVGREGELRQLLALADRSHAGEAVSVLVHGEAGVGKTRLVSDLIAAVREQDGVVLVGHGVHLAGGEVPFGVLAESLRGLVRAVGPEEVREILGPDTEHLAPLVPALRSRGRDEADRARVIGAVADLVEGLATERTVCWVVEDLQWCDAATRDAFTYLTRFVSSARLLTVATWRDEDGGPARVDEVTESVELRALHGADLDALVAAVTPGFLVRHRERVAALSGGLPFLVEELAESWRPEVGVDPAYLRRLVLTRLPDLSPAARELVELAAIGEGHLDVRLLGEGLGVDRTTIREAVEAGLLAGDGASGTLRFRHALLREAVVDAMPPDDRRWHNRRWAEAVEADRVVLTERERVAALASHWHDALVPEKALPALAEVARAAHRLPAPRVEHQALGRILGWWDRVPEAPALTGMRRERVLVDTVQQAMLTAEFDHACCVLEKERERARTVDDPISEAWVAVRIAVFNDNFRVTVPPRTAIEVLLDGRPGDPRVVDGLYLASTQGLPEDLEARVVDLLRQQRDHGADRGERVAAALTLTWIDKRAGDLDHTLALVRRNRELAEGADLVDAWLIAWHEAWWLIVLGRAAEAVEVLEVQLARLSRPSTQSQSYQLMAENLAHAYIAVGRWDEAVELARSALMAVPELCDDEPVLLPGDALRTHLSTVQAARGELEEARRTARSVEAHAGPTPWADREPRAEILAALAALAAAEGDLEGCRAVLAGAWRLGPDLAPTEEVPRAVLTALRAESRLVNRLSASEASASTAVVDAVMEVARRLPRGGPRGTAWRAEARAHEARSRGRDSAADWVPAVTGWRECGQPYDVALCLFHLGEARVAAGDADAATEALSEAYDICTDLSARPLAAAVVALARRRRLPVGPSPERDPGPLTGREVEVLRLVAEGWSNKQIADELFLSPKTVSVHVSRILAKLGAANRTEAAAEARRSGLLGE